MKPQSNSVMNLEPEMLGACQKLVLWKKSYLFKTQFKQFILKLFQVTNYHLEETTCRLSDEMDVQHSPSYPVTF